MNMNMQQREEKQLEATLQAILNKVNDLKGAIQALITKLETEHETINWPTFLDNYAILSGHLTGLSKILQAELASSLRSRIVLPLQLSCERDEALVRLTEGRVPACTHDLVPDLLRTKPEPQAEQRLQQFNHKASTLSYDTAQKQVAQFAKVVSHVWEIISKGREDWEGESMRSAAMQPTHIIGDTHALVTAVGTGKGLRPGMPALGPGPGVGATLGPRGPAPPLGPSAPALPKAPSAIKTNIKAANQIHPYQR
ncbi:mediator of RNA polymerase II transcription subunit 8 [Galleria mellonella]|uniref:Mediator of RNA polymerase II transcription subunit 8 n=1 Tax=Galleria mellonella TaxID=7137 RepID=A0ABM3MTH1_GALME|nr:mediator of RNA polymerase II transcription subunit 8 [Galleria mellonella]XP_052754663.1 mediator of RNA polymerase II transcription subunit 8 [Galleria mellonella]